MSKYNNKNISKEYKTLRDYVKNVTNKTSTTIDGDIADVLEVSEKTIQNVSAGTRNFKWGEAKKVARYFLDSAKDCSDVVVLRNLVKSFLNICASIDEDADVSSEAINILLTEYIKDNETAEKGLMESTSGNRYSNLPDYHYGNSIIRKSLLSQITNTINDQKVVFLSGFSGTGKTFIANAVAHSYFEPSSDEYQVAIWNDCISDSMSFNKLISNILMAFNMKNSGNLSASEKEEYALRALSKTRSIIVIDGFEAIDEENDKQNILSFLSKKASKNIVIITCNKRINQYKDIIVSSHLFGEISMEGFALDEWKKLSGAYCKSRSDIAEAIKYFPRLEDYVFDLCKGNPFLMTHVLAAVTEKLLTGVTYEKVKKEYYLSDVVPKPYDEILHKSVEELSDNCIQVLIALSLFAAPISLAVISEVAGVEGVDTDGSLLNGSDLEISILKCHNLFLVNRAFSYGEIKFLLPDMLKPILKNIREKEQAKYSEIIKRWIKHYETFSETIGFCFDDVKRLSALDGTSNDREIDNIILLLDYCEDKKLWRSFYTISENTKYFFYTRGISGEGNRSVHYRRALAARELHEYDNEFNSLLYHCNVSCKARSWDNIEDSFTRIDELLNIVNDIPEESKLKYQYIKALYYYSLDEFEKALDLFARYEHAIKELMEREKTNKIIIHDYIACLRWHCECIYLSVVSEKGSAKSIEKSIDAVNQMLDTAIGLSEKIGFERAIVHSHLIRIKFYLIEKSDKKRIREIFKQLEDYRQVVSDDIMYNTEYKSLNEICENLLGDK